MTMSSLKVLIALPMDLVGLVSLSLLLQEMLSRFLMYSIQTQESV